MTDTSDKIEVLSITSPDYVTRLDRPKFEAMRDAMLAILPADAPGITVAEAKKRLLPLLPNDLFPGGEKAGWWLKAVQLDQEARGTIKRAPGSPVRLYRT
ncbi:MAG: hypothetical protein JJ864_09295 [Rhizobiaceae bacterium]|nr:hypothetical protein [Rhizobiaceae bacterium]